MARHLPRPTDSELAILRVLWERGSSTVRQVHEALALSRARAASERATRPERGSWGPTRARAGGPRGDAPGSNDTGYTTTLKLMQIMAEKGLVTRDESARTHIYSARVPRAETQRQLVSDLVDRAFGGSAAALVMQALSARAASPEDIAEIQRLIQQFTQESRS